jgi:hypothetical protein
MCPHDSLFSDMSVSWDNALGLQPFMNYCYCRLQGPAFRDLAGKAHLILVPSFINHFS